MRIFLGIMSLRDKLFFRLRFGIANNITSTIRRWWLGLMGMQIGRGILPRLEVNWPHQVSIGDGFVMERGVRFKFDGIWAPGPSIVIGQAVFLGCGVEFNIKSGISIGDNCLVASGCKFVDHDHGIHLGAPMNSQVGPERKIHVSNDVWLGYSCIILKGCCIGEGAVVAAGAVVNQDIPPFEIWGGIPARKIGERK